MTESYNYLIGTGTIVPSTEDILDGVISEYKAALGENINPSSATAQGTLIGGETAARARAMRRNCENANVINPQLSFGPFLDSVCSLLNVKRGNNLSTVYKDVLAKGTPFIPVAEGSAVRAASGELFVTTAPFTIGADGTARVSLKSKTFGLVILNGPITIVDGTIGWGSMSVDSLTTYVAGEVAMSDPKLKNARNQKLSIMGRGSSAAIRAAVLSVDNVTSVNVIENNTGEIKTVAGVQFTKPNAMWVCVAGVGDPAEIAAALYASHQGGCPWDLGASGVGIPHTPVSTRDKYTNIPYETLWCTPVMYDTYVEITVEQRKSPSDPVATIPGVILDYAAGKLEGEDGFIVGASVSAFELGGAVSASMPGLYVKSVKVACVLAGAAAPTPGDYSTEYVIKPFDQAQISIGNIAVVAL